MKNHVIYNLIKKLFFPFPFTFKPCHLKNFPFVIGDQAAVNAAVPCSGNTLAGVSTHVVSTLTPAPLPHAIRHTEDLAFVPWGIIVSYSSPFLEGSSQPALHP